MPDPYQDAEQAAYDRIQARRSGRSSPAGTSRLGNVGALASRAWEWGNKPLWDAPERWGQEAVDYVNQNPTMQSPQMKATAYALKGLGSLASGMSSPISAGTTAATLGAGGLARAGLQSTAKGLVNVARGAGAVGLGHGAYTAEEGLREGDYGRAGAGVLESLGGYFGLKTPMPKGPRSLGAGAITEAPPPLKAPEVSPSAGLGAGGTNVTSSHFGWSSPGTPGIGRVTVSPGPRPNTNMFSYSVPQEPIVPPPQPRGGPRLLPQEAGPSSYPAAPSYYAGPPGTSVEVAGGPRMGVIERARTQASQGMGAAPVGPNVQGAIGTQTPAQSAFDALVPNRWKAVSSATRTPLGDVVEPPGPSQFLNQRGEVIGGGGPIEPAGLSPNIEQWRNQPPMPIAAQEERKQLAKQGLKSLGIEEKPAPKPKAKAAPKPAPAPIVEPVVEPVVEAAPPATAGVKGKRMWEKTPTDTVQALAKRGNQAAIDELKLRGVGPVESPVKGDVGPVGTKTPPAPKVEAPKVEGEAPKTVKLVPSLKAWGDKLIAKGMSAADIESEVVKAQAKYGEKHAPAFEKLKSYLTQRLTRQAAGPQTRPIGDMLKESVEAGKREASKFQAQAGASTVGKEGGTPRTGGLFKKFVESEEGAVSIDDIKEATKKLGSGIEQARMTSMLSGLAVPKSLLGNVGAHLTAALENRSLAPIRALGDVGSIAQDLKTGWQGGHNPTMLAGFGKMNVPGRIMGAADYAATKSLQRAGLTEDAAKEILLTNENPISGWKAMQNPLARYVWPFRTTPINQFAQGLTRWQKHPGLWGGAIAGGAAAGSVTDDPETLALISSLAGPYALPVLAGASMTGGARALQGISPVPEWSIVRSFTEPQASFTESPGLRWLEPGLGFGASEKKTTPGRKVPTRKVPSRKVKR